jgi:hypothetical protein
MAAPDLTRTQRLKNLRAPNPIFMQGEVVYLQRDMQGFAKGLAAKVVVAVPGSGSIERARLHRYQVLLESDGKMHKIWVFEQDLRATKPGMSLTQSNATLSLAQLLAPPPEVPEPLANTTPLHKEGP